MTKTHKERIEEVVEKYVSELRDWGWSMHKFSGEEAFTHEQVKRIISTLNTTLLTLRREWLEEAVAMEIERIVRWAEKRHDKLADTMESSEDRACDVLNELVDYITDNKES